MQSQLLTDLELLNLFQQRQKYIAELLELSRQQETVAQSDDYNQLLNLLGQKQTIISQLDETSRQMPHLRENWHAVRDQAEAKLRARCESVLEQSESSLATLLEIEKKCTSVLNDKQSKTKQQLREISSGGNVHEAYRDPLATETHRYLDVGQ